MIAAKMSAQNCRLVQIATVAFTSAAFTLLADSINFRAPANILWMIGLPMIVGLTTNVGWDRRCFMAILLVGVSIVTTIFVGVNFTSYA